MKSLLRFQLLLFQEFLFEGEQRFRKGNSTGFHARDTAGIHCYGSRTNCALYLIKPRIISLTRADPLFFLPTASLRSHLLQFSILPFVRRPPLSLSPLTSILVVGQKLVVSPDFLHIRDVPRRFFLEKITRVRLFFPGESSICNT